MTIHPLVKTSEGSNDQSSSQSHKGSFHEVKSKAMPHRSCQSQASDGVLSLSHLGRIPRQSRAISQIPVGVDLFSGAHARKTREDPQTLFQQRTSLGVTTRDMGSTNRIRLWKTQNSPGRKQAAESTQKQALATS